MSAINDEGEALLKQHELFVGFAYPDPVSPLAKALVARGLWRGVLRGAAIPADLAGLSGTPWTIGYGFTDNVKPGDTMTKAEADAKLDDDLEHYVKEVRAMCAILPNENQLAGLVVCAWNIGIEGLHGSSIIKAHNRGDFAAAARAFNLWNKAGGQVVQELVVRRSAEAALYLKAVAALPGPVDTPMDDDGPAPSMPQTVTAPSSLLKSPIVTTVVTTAGGGLTAIGAVADQISQFKSSLDSVSFLMPYLPAILMVGVVVASGLVIYYRWKQRHGGWA